VMGRAVSIHPLAVVLGISTGGVLAGILGALLAVPTIAFLNSAVRVLLERPGDSGGPDEWPDEPLGISAEPDRLEPPKSDG
jgi:predicted PurR-regulated permease PerM